MSTEIFVAAVVLTTLFAIIGIVIISFFIEDEIYELRDNHRWTDDPVAAQVLHERMQKKIAIIDLLIPRYLQRHHHNLYASWCSWR